MNRGAFGRRGDVGELLDVLAVPTMSSRVSNFCASWGGTAPVKRDGLLHLQGAVLGQSWPRRMNVERCPRRALAGASGPRADRRCSRRQNAIIAPIRRSVRDGRCSRARGTASHLDRPGARPVRFASNVISEVRPDGTRRGPSRIVARVSQQQWGGPQYAPPRALRSKAPRPMAAMAPRAQAVMVHAGRWQSGIRRVLRPGLSRPRASGNPPSAAGVPQYGPAPAMPAPRGRNPLLICCSRADHHCAVALGGLVIAAELRPSDVAYQNDNYQVPPPDTNPPPIPAPETYEEAEDLITQTRSTTRPSGSGALQFASRSM